MKKSGAIINVSLINGNTLIAPKSIDYNISKVGLQSLTRDLDYELKPNIRVNAVAIGLGDTNIYLKNILMKKIRKYI